MQTTPVSTAVISTGIIFVCISAAVDLPAALHLDYRGLVGDGTFSALADYANRFVWTPAKCFFAWQSIAEATAGSILLHRLRVCEHLWGSRHFACFIISILLVEAVFVFGAIAAAPYISSFLDPNHGAKLGDGLKGATVRSVQSWLPLHSCAIAPFSLCSALLVRFLLETPVRAKFKVLGLKLNNKALEVILTAQIIGYNFPSSLVMILPAFITSLAFSRNLFSLRSAAIPLSVWTWFAAIGGSSSIFDCSAFCRSLAHRWRNLDLRNLATPQPEANAPMDAADTRLGTGYVSGWRRSAHVGYSSVPHGGAVQPGGREGQGGTLREGQGGREEVEDAALAEAIRLSLAEQHRGRAPA